MSNIVEYLPVATDPSANVEDQTAWLADTNRTLGFQSGIAPSKAFNKAWRQPSVMSAALANAISEALAVDILDDGNVEALVSKLNLYIQAVVLANLPSVLRIQDSIFASGTGGPYALPHPPNGTLLLVFFDIAKQQPANYIINSAGTELSLAGGVDHTLFNSVEIVYAY